MSAFRPSIQAHLGPCPDRKRRIARLAALCLFLLLWLAVLLLAGEYVARGRLAAQWRKAKGIQEERAAQQMAAMRAAVPGLAIDRSASDAERFESLGEEERPAWATRRDEAAFLCTHEGVLLRSYVPAPMTAVHRLAAQMVPGQDLGTQLAQRYTDPSLADPVHGLSEVVGGKLPREIAWPQPIRYAGDQWSLFQFRIRPLAHSGTGATTVVFLRQSIWEQWGVRYARNVRLEDNFEWSAEELPTFQFHTNNLGFRGKDVAVPKPAGVYRIVCVGASTTVEGVTDAFTYPAVLERALREAFGYEGIEVVNAGVHGVNASTELARAVDYAALEPDLILEYNFINDYRALASFQWSAPQELAGRPLRRLRSWLRESSLVYLLCPSLLAPSMEELARDCGQVILPNLRALRQALIPCGAQLCFLSFASPDPALLSPEERLHFEFMHYKWNFNRTVMDLDGYDALVGTYNRQLQALCAETGAVYLPVAEALRQHPEFFTDLCHFTVQGIAFKADLIASMIHDQVAEGLRRKRGGATMGGGARLFPCGVTGEAS